MNYKEELLPHFLDHLKVSAELEEAVETDHLSVGGCFVLSGCDRLGALCHLANRT